jgi:serine/threonine protein phosphatase 1
LALKEHAVSRTYAIPDLHGRCDLLNAAIERILDHSRGVAAKAVTLGDYIDRGPESRQVMERLVNWSSKALPLVALKGNHEAMMWECCKNLSETGWWLKNGGDQTLSSYGQSAATLQVSAVPAAHLDWIARLPSMHVDEHRIFVHAGVEADIPLNHQSDQILLWKRYPDAFKKGHGRHHVVHGHDAKPDGPILTKGRTNLDTLAWKTGRLAIGVFEDGIPGGPSEILEINC